MVLVTVIKSDKMTSRDKQRGKLTLDKFYDTQVCSTCMQDFCYVWAALQACVITV